MFNDLNTSEKIRLVLKRDEKTQVWLANMWGISAPALAKKFKKNDWREKDLRILCNILMIKYSISFKCNGEWDMMSDISTSEKIRLIMNRMGITQKQLSDEWGIAQGSFAKKLKANDWREKDLQIICKIVGMEYSIIFKYGDEWI